MSNRNDDWKNSNLKTTFSNKQYEGEEIGTLRSSREKDNHYNLNVATFTFGGRQNINNLLIENSSDPNSNTFKKSISNIRPQTIGSKEKDLNLNSDYNPNNYYNKTNNLSLIPNKSLRNISISENSNMNTMSNQVNTINNNSTISNNNINLTNNSNDVSQNQNVYVNVNTNPNNLTNVNIPIKNNQANFVHSVPILLNRIGDHNSFLSVVIHALWNLKIMRNFIIKDLNTLNEKESKNKLFYHLKSLFLKYERNKVIDTNKLRVALAETFQHRRKFLLDQPDDPIDCYFAFINAIHSHHIQSTLGEIKDTNCYSKCLAHKYLWIDLCRVDECECKGTSKRLFSYHNYIFDIPLEKIFNFANNGNIIEMSKSFKIKSINNKNKNNTSNVSNELNQISIINNLSDLKGKLFLYFKMLFSQLKTDCPEKGPNCEINKTHRAFFLANIPYNLNFSLVNPKKYGKILSHIEILKTFILIPKILDLSVLFDYSSKQKVFYEFLGAFLIKPSKSYSCFFRQNNADDTFSWIYYDCGKVASILEHNPNLSFNNWFDLISHCLANGEYPIMLFYQIQQKYIDNEKEITNEEIHLLERYAKSADNFNAIVLYKFRPTEDIIKSEDLSVRSSMNLNNNNPNLEAKVNQSKGSSSIATSRNTSNNNSNSRIDLATGEYNCIYCFSKNRIENNICFKCNKNNEAVIEDIMKKRHLNSNNYINIANFNLNINTEDKMSFKSKQGSSLNDKNQSTNILSDKERENNNNNNNTIENKYEIRSDRESKSASIKKHSESIQPQPIYNQQIKNPFQMENTKKEKERINNINTITIDEDLNLRHLNMPKQISNKLIANNLNINKMNNPKEVSYNNNNSDKASNINNLNAKEYLNSPPSISLNRSNSKKNLLTHNKNGNQQNNLNCNNPKNNNNTEPLYIPEHLQQKKLETITTSSYVSTPVFNKEKDREKTNEKDKARVIEDRLKPYAENEKKKINLLNSGNNNSNSNHDKNSLGKPQQQQTSVEKKMTYGITNPNNGHDHWICEYCSSLNRNENNKCSECKRAYQPSIRESFNKNDSYNQMSEKNFKDSDSFNIQETFGNRQKNYNPMYVNQVQINLTNTNSNNKKNQSMDKKNTKNFICSPASDKKLVINNYFSEKSESIKKNSCPCNSHYDESLLRNNMCRLCGRLVDLNPNNQAYGSNNNAQNQVTYLDNILKRKGYESELHSKPNSMKKANEKERPVMIHDNAINNKRKEFEKMKSPTSNNVKARVVQDERIGSNQQNNHQLGKHPSKEIIKDNKDKDSSKQSRIMSSSNKKIKLEINKQRK